MNEKDRRKICTKCGFLGNPKEVTRGMFILEVILWLCWLVPGLLYSCWRLAGRHWACPKCAGKETMIPSDSPVGIQMLDEIRRKAGSQTA